jgi:hypothetical protein
VFVFVAVSFATVFGFVSTGSGALVAVSQSEFRFVDLIEFLDFVLVVSHCLLLII